jgi:RimJ/RimL family protein N-acetyltransferase
MEPTQVQSGQSVVNIVGERVALGPLVPELLPLVHKWLNDFEVRAYQGFELRPVSFDASKERFERAVKDETAARFCIYERSTMRAIGMTSLDDVNRVNRAAEFDIRIGEKDCWGRGYGTETTRLVLDYGFTALGLHNIHLRVLSYNERAIRAYTRAGFKLAGRLREAWRLGNRAYDLIYMDCLATEFQGSVLRSLLPNA